MQIKLDDLVNQLSYQELLDDPHATALIMTGNGKQLSILTENELQNDDWNELKYNKRTLMDVALSHGDLDAIHVLVESQRFKDDAATLKKYLKVLFTEFESVRVDHPSEDISFSLEHRKSKVNIINIYNYLKEHVGKDSPVWSDEHTMNNLVAVAARGKVVTLDALLELGYVTNVNTPDETGKTAAYYLTQKNTDTPLIEELKKRGQEFSAQDVLAQSQNALAKNLMSAIENKDREQINSYLTELQSNQSSLTQLQFTNCLYKAIDLDDEATVLALITSECGRQFNLDWKYIANIKSIDMMYTIAYSALTHQSHVENDSQFQEEIKRFSHRVGVGGDIKVKSPSQYNGYVELKLEGSSAAKSLPALQEALEGYNSTEEFNPLSNAVRFTRNVYELSTDGIGQHAPELFLKHYEQGRPLIVPVGWDGSSYGHVIGVGIQYDSKNNKTYLSVSNRGAGGLNIALTEQAKSTFGVQTNATGTVVYAMNGLIDFQISTITTRFPGLKECADVLQNILSNMQPVAILPAQEQKYGTCTYVNVKRTIEGLLFIDALCTGQPVDQKTKDEVYLKYKLFSIDDKKQACLHLIHYYKAHTANSNVDPVKTNILNELIVQIIHRHHSLKHDAVELNLSRQLYAILPKSYQDIAVVVAPELLDPKIGPSQNEGILMSERTRIRPIHVIGDFKVLYKYNENINNLLKIFSEHNITSEVIKIVSIDAKGELSISGKKGMKQQILDVCMQLGATDADIKGVEKRAKVIIPDLNKLMTVLSEDKQEPGEAVCISP